MSKIEEVLPKVIGNVEVSNLQAKGRGPHQYALNSPIIVE